MLNPYLGMKWDRRILNPAGNLAYEIPGTINHWEQHIKSEIENSYFITFQFGRGDGNRNNYQANM